MYQRRSDGNARHPGNGHIVGLGCNITIDGSSLASRPAPSSPHHGHGAHHRGRGSVLLAANGHQIGPSAYEQSVREQLLAAIMFRTGAAVVNAIWRRPRRLRIVPWTQPGFNAWTAALNGSAATAPGTPWFNGTPPQAQGLGNGHGSNIRIQYSPSISQDDTRLYFLDRHAHDPRAIPTGIAHSAPGNDCGELLLHEMIHGLAWMSGCGRGFSPTNDTWDSADEFLPIFVTDIFASERGRPLRITHRFGVLSSNPSVWSTNPALASQIAAIANTAPLHDFVNDLRNIDTRFNPLHGRYGATDSMH